VQICRGVAAQPEFAPDRTCATCSNGARAQTKGASLSVCVLVQAAGNSKKNRAYELMPFLNRSQAGLWMI